MSVNTDVLSLKYNQISPMKRMASKRIVHQALLLGGAAFIASTSLALNSVPSAGTQSKKDSALKSKIDESSLNSDQDLNSSYAPIVQKVAPSVVTIFVSSSVPELSRLSDKTSISFAPSLAIFLGSQVHYSNMPWARV